MSKKKMHDVYQKKKRLKKDKLLKFRNAVIERVIVFKFLDVCIDEKFEMLIPHKILRKKNVKNYRNNISSQSSFEPKSNVDIVSLYLFNMYD